MREDENTTCVKDTRQGAYRDLRVVADAREDALGHSADDPRRVAHALIDAKLDILFAQEEGASSKQVCCCLCADPCTRTTFGKEEGNSLVLKWVRVSPSAGSLLPLCDRTKERSKFLLEAGSVHDEGVDVAHRQVGECHQVRRPADRRKDHDGCVF